MPQFNQHAARRMVTKRGMTVTLRNTALVYDDDSDWGDETETESEYQVRALLRRPNATPEMILDVEGFEPSSHYVVYLRDDVEMNLYDDTAENHKATEFDFGNQTYRAIMAPPESQNGVYRIPVERA